ncbi:MAG: sulfite exporter TauE/SafE family protein [Myxococcales bacterium]|nr:MAG: sulfite exporter TauE/SafE family protein [Myxococcales bacterium]
MFEYLLLCIAGVFAGYINAMAGAGSLLTLPALIFTGLDANAANATNRISVLFQTIATSITYKRHGIAIQKKQLWILFPSCVGGILGAYAATRFSKEVFQVCIAIVMLFMLPLNFIKKRNNDGSHTDLPFNWPTAFVFLAIGFYAGFIQAAAGLIILFYLAYATRMNLIQANAIKVSIIMVLTLWALVTFFFFDAQIDFGRGLLLALSTAIGGVLGAHASVKRGEKLIRVVLTITVLASAANLLWRALT